MEGWEVSILWSFLRLTEGMRDVLNEPMADEVLRGASLVSELLR